MVLVNTEAPARGPRGKTCENPTKILGVAPPPPPACGIEGSLCRMGCCQRVAVYERVDAQAESTHQVARNTAKVTNECTLIRLYACAMATRCRQQHPTQRSLPPPFVPAPLPAGGHTSSSSRRPARLEWGSLRSCTSLAPRLWSGPRTSPRVSSRNSVPSPLLPCHRLRWVPHSNPLFLRPEYRLTDPPISQGLSASASTSPSLALSRQPMTSARPWLEPGDTRHGSFSLPLSLIFKVHTKRPPQIPLEIAFSLTVVASQGASLLADCPAQRSGLEHCQGGDSRIERGESVTSVQESPLSLPHSLLHRLEQSPTHSLLQQYSLFVRTLDPPLFEPLDPCVEESFTVDAESHSGINLTVSPSPPNLCAECRVGCQQGHCQRRVPRPPFCLHDWFLPQRRPHGQV